jgi:transposase-like protein
MTSSRDHRAAILAEQAASGLSIVQFCRRRGIALSTFHSWRSRPQGRHRARGRGDGDDIDLPPILGPVTMRVGLIPSVA